MENTRVWAAMIGGNLQLSPRESYFGSMTQVWGGVAGFERLFDSSLKAGISFGGTSSNVSVSGLQSNGQANYGHGAIYAHKSFGGAYALGAFGWSIGHSSTSRNALLLGGFQTGSFDGQGPSGRIETGYRFSFPRFDLTPYIAFQGSWIRQNGMRESGDPIGSLYFKGQTISSAPGSIGFQIGKVFALDQGWDTTLRGRAAYVRDFSSTRSITAQLYGVSQPFIASGIPMPLNSVDLGAGIEFANKNGFSASLTADALMGKDAIGWKGQASLTFVW